MICIRRMGGVEILERGGDLMLIHQLRLQTHFEQRLVTVLKIHPANLMSPTCMYSGFQVGCHDLIANIRNLLGNCAHGWNVIQNCWTTNLKTTVARTTNALEHKLQWEKLMCRGYICSLFARNIEVSFLIVAECWTTQRML